MVSGQVESQDRNRRSNTAPVQTFDRAEVIKLACLKRCATMADERYDFGAPLAKADRIMTVVVAIVCLAIMFLGARI